MDLNAARIFVRVVRLGSFTKAARDLDLPNSTVSDRVSDLERSLGVSLLVRTTRRLHLTDAGAVFFKKAELALDALLSAGEEASSFQKRPAGTLKITAPTELDYTSIWEAVLEYRERFPEMNVELLMTDRLVDMVGEGFDIAIRASAAGDANFTAKRLGKSGHILVAAPRYVQKSSLLRHPRDLLSHECLVISPENDPRGAATWKLVSSSGATVKIEPPARITSNSVGAIKHLVVLGEGISLVPPTLVHEDIGRGRLVRVLPGWSTRPWPSYLVYKASKLSAPKVREMIPLLEPRIRKVIK